MNILQANTADITGGAERIAFDLFKGYQSKGHGSWLAVGRKFGTDPNVLVIPNHATRNQWAQFWEAIEQQLGQSNYRLLNSHTRHLSKGIGQPARTLRTLQGKEDFDFPGTASILALPAVFPDIFHCHNLHGGYFDLRELSAISHKIPFVLTLHDAWLLSGHCAHSLSCERWQIGCGQCPDLSLYPSVYRDATAYNWQVKKAIYAQSRVYVATPSQWLMNKVDQSILTPAIAHKRVIPNGVDLTIFRPNDKAHARYELGLPLDTPIILFIANGVRQNKWKDYDTMRQAVKMLTEKTAQPALFLAVGEDAPEEHDGLTTIRFIPFQQDTQIVAKYLQAADLYVHLTHADTFPTTVLEALACGTPVIGTAIGGIPEQIQDYETGFLVPPRDHGTTAHRMVELLENAELRVKMSELAISRAKQKFDINHQVQQYLSWYEEILADQSRENTLASN